MTNGGPGTATLVLYQYTWQNAFKLYEMGYASAIGYFMGIIILVLSAINMYMNRDKDVDEVKKRRKAKLKAQKEGGAANA
jgi:ABC-type sugar transport system permease subunit